MIVFQDEFCGNLLNMHRYLQFAAFVPGGLKNEENAE
jgi:hypothetical protein